MVKQSRSSGGGGGGDDAKHEVKLQAVLLAHSFTHTFRPLSLDTAKVLCPLNNVTLLDYAMEFLAGAGVEELVVVCTRDEVETYVTQHAWSTATSSMHVTCVKDGSITNAGDALRELDKRNLVQSDPFILMHGDTVTNVDVGPVLAAHKKRHKKDSSAIMTLLFKRVGGWKVDSSDSVGESSARTIHSPLRSATEDLVVGLDPTLENRVLVYDDHSHSKNVSVPCSFFASHPQVELRCDLLDCGIDICSPDVLARFSDEFDYRDIRREFVANSVAEEEEGLQNKIYAHLLGPAEYAARVHDFATYDAVSKDLLRRWCYPVVPDNLPSGYEKQYRYVQQRHYLYREMKSGQTKIGRSSELNGPGIVGSQCHIGDECVIEGTVIGNHCNIESGVTLVDCHLWENVTVEEGATVIQSILANDCVIKSGATVGRGCIIGRGCVVGAAVVLPEFTRITQSVEKQGSYDEDDDFGDFDDSSDDEDEDSEDEEESQDEQAVTAVSDHGVVGPDGVGRVWIPSTTDDDDSDEDDEGDAPLDVMKAQSIGYDPSPLYRNRLELQEEEEDVLSDDDHTYDMNFDDEYDNVVASFDRPEPSNLNEHGVLITGRQRGVDVVKELKAICMEHETTSPIENLSIELNSFKFSQNATYSDCTMAATLSILEKMNITSSMSAGKLVAALKSQLDHWAPLLRKMSIGLDEEKSIVSTLETAALGGGEMGDTLNKEPAFRFLLQTLHDEEVVSEAVILSWAAERRDDDPESPRGKLFQQQPTQDFLEWLQEESEDDDSEAEEESSEE